MPEQTVEETSLGFIANLFTPEAVLMLTFAILIDGGEAFFELVPFVGGIISIMIDIIALIFIGAWMYFRSRNITAPKKTAGRIKKVIKFTKKFKWLKPACMIFEMIPVVSSFAPLWVVAVFIELASKKE
ncbi:MAG: hypothetical protein ACTSWD_15115 [Candidatus Heimdallarchaeota archaeon]